ncbi:MAG: cytochrome bc complex cytochrome b subunit [Planctomycetota bacterium]
MMRQKLYQWLDRRYQLAPLIEFARKKEVPLGTHSLLWYYLGGTALFFFLVQIVSGILLLMYYQPGDSTAYETIRYITTKVPFGWLVRSVHVWSAHLMIITLVLHMFSTFFFKAYRSPRELTWLIGFLMFGLALGFGFSGYLLPWNELAFFATLVGTDSVKSIPIFGEWLLLVLRGGPDVTINTLYRFFALHVVVLPLLTLLFVGIHLLFVQRQGMAPPVGTLSAPRGIRFFPGFALRDALLWLVCLIGLGALAVFLPYGPGIPGFDWELGRKADPLAPAYPGIKPEWYFLWVYQLLKEFPPHVLGLEGPQAALLLVTGLVLIWIFIPWIDRPSARNRLSPAASDLGVAAILFLSFLTLKAWDIGGKTTASELPDPRAVAWVCAWITLALGAAIALLRLLYYKHRWFLLSSAALLQVALHGVFGVAYLPAGVIALAAAGVGIGIAVIRSKGRATSLEGEP